MGSACSDSGSQSLLFSQIVDDVFNLAYDNDTAAVENKLRLYPHLVYAHHPSNSSTLLHIGASRGNKDLVLMLIARGAEVNDIDDTFSTPLHHAASKGHAQVLVLLKKHGGDLRLQNIDHQLPLHMACKNGKSDIAKIIIINFQCYDTIDSVDKRGLTCLHYAAGNGHLETTKVIVDLTPSHMLDMLLNSICFNMKETAKGKADRLRYFEVVKYLDECMKSINGYGHCNRSSNNIEDKNTNFFSKSNSFEDNFVNTRSNLKIISSSNSGFVKYNNRSIHGSDSDSNNGNRSDISTCSISISLSNSIVKV